MVLVVMASRQDQFAQALVSRWTAHDAALFTCADLSVSGWRYRPQSIEDSKAVIGGQAVATREITGVLTRLPCVLEQELINIVPVDRPYVATEMTAFLLAWLSGLKCPVLNRPTPTCLSGPYWRQEQWICAAAQAGIPVRPVRRRTTLLAGASVESPDSPPITVTVIGNQCFGVVDGMLADQARRLAKIAGVDLLAVHFSDSQQSASFINADVWPDLADDGVAEAVLAYLQDGYAR